MGDWQSTALTILGVACGTIGIRSLLFGVEKGEGRVFGLVFSAVVYLVGRGAIAVITAPP
jgi:hypothetical protein